MRKLILVLMLMMVSGVGYSQITDGVSSSTIKEVVVEKLVGTVGRSDYPDLSSDPFKVLSDSDFDTTMGSYYHLAADADDDSTTNSRNLTPINTPTYTTNGGPDGVVDSINLDGVDQCLSYNGYDDTGSFTLFGWFKKDVATTLQTYATKATSTVAERSWFLADETSGAKIRFQLFVDAGGTKIDFYADKPSLADTNWHFVTAVYNQSSTSMKIYYDAELIGTKIDSSLSVRNNSAASDLTIGAQYCASNFWDGGMSNIGYEPVAMDIHQIRRIYHSSELASHHGGLGHTLTADSFSRTITDKIVFYNMGDSAVLPQDVSGNGKHFNSGVALSQVTGMAGVSSTASDFTTGKDIKFTTDATFKATQAISFGGWYALDDWTPSGNRFLVFQGTSSGTAMGYDFLLDSGGIGFRTSTDGTSIVGLLNLKDATSWANNEWHHMVVTISSNVNGVVTLYIDGEQAHSYTFTGTLHASVNDMHLGHRATIDDFEGYSDEFFFAKYALSANEIAALASMTAPHSLSSNIYQMSLPGKETYSNGLMSKFRGEDYERGTTASNLYFDFSSLDPASKVQVWAK